VPARRQTWHRPRGSAHDTPTPRGVGQGTCEHTIAFNRPTARDSAIAAATTRRQLAGAPDPGQSLPGLDFGGASRGRAGCQGSPVRGARSAAAGPTLTARQHAPQFRRVVAGEQSTCLAGRVQLGHPDYGTVVLARRSGGAAGAGAGAATKVQRLLCAGSLTKSSQVVPGRLRTRPKMSLCRPGG
jgi:hypothetical protein